MSDTTKQSNSDTETAETPTTLADVGKALYTFLTQRKAAIDYRFDDMTIEVPKDTGNAPRATWKINGKMSISVNETES
ncbi:MAG: hypothetical protein AAF708_04295 [Deinococcota bacterium]